MKIVSLLPLALVVLAGCAGKAGTQTFSSVDGAYEGEGKFSADAGSMKLKGKLVLDSKGRYTLQISPMGSLGNDSGTYTLQGQNLLLTPEPPQAKFDANGRPTLASALQRSAQPKTMKAVPGFAVVEWADGPMQFTFRRTS